MRKIIVNISSLFGILPPDVLRLQGAEMGHVETLHDAWLKLADGKIAAFGSMDDLREERYDEVIDAAGAV
jgi:hypothetical protein